MNCKHLDLGKERIRKEKTKRRKRNSYLETKSQQNLKNA